MRKFGFLHAATALCAGIFGASPAAASAPDPVVIRAKNDHYERQRRTHLPDERRVHEPHYYGSAVRLVVRPDLNQRQRRKLRRSKHAAGFRRAFH